MPNAPKSPRDAAADIGEAVSLVGRAAGSALDRFGQMAGDLLSGLSSGSEALTTDVLPEERPLHPVERGATVTTRVRIVNESEAATEPFTLTAGDLVSDGGGRIAADAVTVGTQQRVVAAGASDTVRVEVAVPGETAPGVYRGELQASDAGVAAAAVSIEVR